MNPRPIAARVAVPTFARDSRYDLLGLGMSSYVWMKVLESATGIHIDAGMLEVARSKPVPESGSVEWLQLGAAEIEDRIAERSLDAVVSCLAMSELSEDEQDYALATAFRRLVAGGRLVIGTKRSREAAGDGSPTAFAAAGALLGDELLAALGAATPGRLAAVATFALLCMAILSIDLAGTTPWYGSYINTWHNDAHIELVEERCIGAAACVQVCPRDVLQMNGRRRKVEIRRPAQCIQCGACIVQCPEDALRFRYDDGRVVEASTIRSTRMNILGRRRVEVEPS